MSESLKQSQWSCWVALPKPAVASNVSAGMDVFSSHFNVSHVRAVKRTTSSTSYSPPQIRQQSSALCWPTAVRKRCIQDFVKGWNKLYPSHSVPSHFPSSLPLHFMLSLPIPLLSFRFSSVPFPPFSGNLGHHPSTIFEIQHAMWCIVMHLATNLCASPVSNFVLIGM